MRRATLLNCILLHSVAQLNCTWDMYLVSFCR